MKHAELLKGNRGSGEVVLVLNRAEFQKIAEAVGLAAAVHPRKTSLKALRRMLEEVEAW